MNVGEETREGEFANMDPGRARREGERPAPGRGEGERCGWPEPVYLRWVRVREKIACERDD